MYNKHAQNYKDFTKLIQGIYTKWFSTDWTSWCIFKLTHQGLPSTCNYRVFTNWLTSGDSKVVFLNYYTNFYPASVHHMQCISGHCYRRSSVVVSVLVTTVIYAKMAEMIKMRSLGADPRGSKKPLLNGDQIPPAGRGTLGGCTPTPLWQLTRQLFAPAGRNQQQAV